MTIRKTIFIGVTTLTIAGGITIGVVLSRNKNKNHALTLPHNSFAEVVNTINEFMDIKVDDPHQVNAYTTGFANPVITFNSRTNALTISFKKIFNLKNKKSVNGNLTNSQIKENLIDLAHAVGVVKNYFGYFLSDLPHHTLTTMSLPSELLIKGVDPTGKYEYQKKNANGDYVYKQILKDPNIYLPKQGYVARDQAAKYQMFGQLDFNLPIIGANGKIIYKKSFGQDLSSRVLINSITGKMTPIALVTAKQIRDAILYQLIKFAWGIDQFKTHLVIKNISFKDIIKDTQIASFDLSQEKSYDANAIHLGKYTSAKGQAVELLKRLINLDVISGSVTQVKLVKNQIEYANLSAEDLKHFHRYDANGNPMGIQSDIISGNKYEKRLVATDLGIVVKNIPKAINNPLKITNSEINTIIEKVAKNERNNFNKSYAHHKDQKATFIAKFNNPDDKAKALSQNKKYSWYRKLEEKQENVKAISERLAIKRLVDQGYLIGDRLKGVDAYNYRYGYASNSLFNFLAAAPKRASLGEFWRDMFNIHYEKRSMREKSWNPVTNPFLKKLDITKIFEKNPNETVFGYNPHPIFSLYHPYILGTNDLGYAGINLAVNYLSTPKTQTRKIFSKMDFKNDIFKDPTNTSNVDLLTKFFINAKVFYDGGIMGLFGKENSKIEVGRAFVIGTAWDKPTIEKILTDANIPLNSVLIKNGFISIYQNYKDENDRNHRSKVVEILKAIFTTKNVRYADIKGTPEANEAPNLMHFKASEIQSAIDNANVIINSETFRKDFVMQPQKAIDSQTFSAPSRVKQNKFNYVYKKIFNPNPATIGQTAIWDSIKKAESSIEENDVSLKGLDQTLVDINFANKEVRVIRRMVNGTTIVSYIKDSVQTEAVWKDKHFSFSTIENLIVSMGDNNKKTFASWLVGKNIDQKVESFIAIAHLLDKLDVKYVINMKSSTTANPKMVTKQIRDTFGTANIFSIRIKETSEYHNFYVELKKGHYKDAMFAYIDKTYQPAIAKNMKIDIQERINEINELF